MENNFNTPAQVIQGNIHGGIGKSNLPAVKLMILGFMAGMFIALGAAVSSMAGHSIVNPSAARIITALIFPIGLMAIVFVDGELFTGNCLIAMAVYDKKTTWLKFFRNLGIVYFANLIGSLFIMVLVYFSGQLEYNGGKLGAYAIKVAIGKSSLTATQEIFSGIICNILVCLAILMAAASRDIIGKIWAIYFPIFAFVLGGFEHSVANMFFVPMGILASTNDKFMNLAKELYGFTPEQLDSLSILEGTKHILFVSLGNFIGGAIILGGICYLIHIKHNSRSNVKNN